ncbi:MAG: acylneuraminate cytidylyltransferase family protein [Armatimonadota bacterium]|nr:MAG: acylneuraminate cytidylyltransferase family protein [Armatimonadota bacterium]
MKQICTICARGGSKGIPGKNLQPFAGRPLLVHTIECAQAYAGFDTIVVSTDDEEVAQIARKAGASVPFLRPPELATDEAPKLPAIQHAVVAVEEHQQTCVDLVVDLQPTSPLRLAEDVAGAVATLLASDAENLVSVCRARRSPYYDMIVLDGGRARFVLDPERPFARRQDVPPIYDLNGAIYVWRREALRTARSVIGEATIIYEMPPERSIDIDTPLDLAVAEFIKRRTEASC